MDAIAYVRQDMQWAHELLDMVMADVTPEQAHWIPPGIANPLGAMYVHAVSAEDGVINVLLRGGAPLFASEWAGKTGASEPRWQIDSEWGRAVKVDLPAFRKYAQAVHAATDGYLASLTAGELDRPIDLSSNGMGQRPVSWVLGALVISHLNNMAGEISVLKGLQGAKGYPF
jgi:hypothetical protein